LTVAPSEAAAQAEGRVGGRRKKLDASKTWRDSSVSPRCHGSSHSIACCPSEPAQEKAIPNVFVKDFQASLACYTGPLGFHALFVYGAACVLSICSAGVIGTAGLSFLRGTDPVIATETTTGCKGPSTKVH